MANSQIHATKVLTNKTKTMETLYRKVSVIDRTPKKNGRYFVWINEPNADNDEDRMFKTIYKDDFGFQSFYEVTYWLEEIPETIKSDNTETLANALQQIKNLESDKAELLEALEKCNNELHFYSGHTNFVKENESLIQKLKND